MVRLSTAFDLLFNHWNASDEVTVYAGTSETDYKQNGGTKDVEIHNPSKRHDVRYVREPRERCGAESISGEEGHFISE